MATKNSKNLKVPPRTLVLLDTHAILHRAYHALPDFASPSGEPTGALFGVVSMLFKIIEELRPDYLVACYDLPEPTYRHVVYEAYKAGRAKADDALVAQIIRSRDLLEAFGIPLYEHPGFEADDMLGTIVEQLKREKNLRIIIASGDMDTLQLVDEERVLVYTLKKGINDTILYSEAKVMERFGFGPEQIPDYKGLRGDPSDNIPGIKGIGEKGATDLITQFGDLDAIYKKLNKDEAAFVRAGIKARLLELLKAGEEEAQFSKMLATIRRDAPITFTLPGKTWRETIDVERALTLFSELGFRTHGPRLSAILGSPAPAAPAATENGELINTEAIQKAALALWLLSSDLTNPTLDDVMQYGRAHQKNTFAEIEALLQEELKTQKLDHLYETIELPLRTVLREMERTGIKVDVDYLKKLGTQFHTELAELEKTIHEQAGTDFNINSPKQLGVVLYDTLGLKPKAQKRTATGQRSTRESELEKLANEHPIIPEILRYRELQKLVGTYVDTIPTLVAKDGRLHTTFLQAGTTTGRMASRDPNIQNIPIRTAEGRAIRRAFVADPDFTLLAIDYSQIELRIAAFLANDQKMIEIFKNGEDVHRGVAARVFHVTPEEVTTDMRRQAKVINFGILYGMGVNALRANLGEATTRADAQEFLNAYFHTFTRLAEYLEETKTFARAHGYTLTYFGRRRHFPGMNSAISFMRAQAERMAINAPVQGTSADLIRVAMVRIHEYLSENQLTNDVRLLLQVHDELVFEVRSSLLATTIPTLKKLMEGVLSLEETRGIPIVAEAKVGPNWEELISL